MENRKEELKRLNDLHSKLVKVKSGCYEIIASANKIIRVIEQMKEK